MELTLDDLAEKCAECDGTGEKKEEPKKSSRQSYGVTPIGSSRSDGSCPTCRGSGRTRLTETGRAIKGLIDAIEKNPMLQYSK